MRVIALAATSALSLAENVDEKLWCSNHTFLPRGGFCPNAPYAGIDKSLANSLATYFGRLRGAARQPTTTIGDFGAGGGWYSALFNSRTGLRSFPYDFSPPPGSAVAKFDLSRPLVGIAEFDYVLCLEVGEHVPAEFEPVLLDNLDHHARHGIVLSWAIPGQDGVGHVNTQPNAYVINQMLARGWVELRRMTAELRERAHHRWFKKSIMVFERVKQKRAAADTHHAQETLGYQVKTTNELQT